MFIVLVEWKVAPSSADAFRDLVLLQAKNSVQEEAGCRLFDVGQKPDAPNQFMLYEIYDSEKEFDAHRQTKHYAEFSSAVEIMTLEKSVSTYTKLEPLKLLRKPART